MPGSYKAVYHNQSAGWALTKQYITTNQQVGFLQSNMSRPICRLGSCKAICHDQSAGWVLTKRYIMTNQQVGFLQNNNSGLKITKDDVSLINTLNIYYVQCIRFLTRKVIRILQGIRL